jgi:hypothetical protein
MNTPYHPALAEGNCSRKDEFQMISLRRIFFCIVPLMCSAFSAHEARAQDFGVLKKRILASLDKIERYPAVVAKGMSIRGEDRKETMEVQYRGGKMSMEMDSLATAEGQDLERIRSVYDVMGTTGLHVMSQFDGKKHYEFSPYNLTLTITTVREAPERFSHSGLLPVFWTQMGGARRQSFRKFLEVKDYETKVEKLAEGRWKLSQSNLGSLLAEGNAKVGIRDRFLIVEEKFDYNITEYFGEGYQGKLSGKMKWEKQDGNWYAKEGEQRAGDKPYLRWQIDEISFDATRCRSRFDDLESTVPFATKIIHQDEKQNALSTTFKGGEDGEVEFRLRELARLKRMKEGF